ncbi:AGAP006143-PD-like protein [Anopheles sinensis]|uniref:Gustatory receptor n=1 Tax=Anopheles sinensis TaxID=74873 RepID=A0A084WEQ3_ANOSI|nr:AGAP006143-PD-like protein [Anopheles sinensis]
MSCVALVIVLVYTMDVLKLLNFFNRMMVSPTFVDTDSRGQRFLIRNRNLYWNASILTILMAICSVALVKLAQETQPLYNVMGTVGLMLYLVQLGVMIPLILWPLANRRVLIRLTNFAFEFSRFVPTHSNPANSKSIEGRLLTIQMTIIFANFVLKMSLVCYHIWQFPELQQRHLLIVHCGFPVMSFFVAVHQVYMLLWPVFIIRQLNELIRRTKIHQPVVIHAVIALSNKVSEFTERFATIFGPMQIVHLLSIFVICCAQSYYIANVIETGYDISISLMENIACVSSFFIYTYLYDLVHEKSIEELVEFQVYTMDELKFLNIFNHMTVSPTFAGIDPRGQRNLIRTRNSYWNATVLATLLIVCSVATIKMIQADIDQKLSNVIEAVEMILYGVQTVVMILLIIWPLASRQDLLRLGNCAMDIHQCIQTQFKPTNSRCIAMQLLKTKMGIVIANLVLKMCLLSYYTCQDSALQQLNDLIVHYGYTLIAFIICVHHVYMLLWPVFIIRQLNELALQAKVQRMESLRTVIDLSDKVDEFLEFFATIFGPVQVVHLLSIFSICCAQSYFIANAMETGYAISFSLLEIVARGSSFFIYTYLYELVNEKVSSKSNATKYEQT